MSNRGGTFGDEKCNLIEERSSGLSRYVLKVEDRCLGQTGSNVRLLGDVGCVNDQQIFNWSQLGYESIAAESWV